MGRLKKASEKKLEIQDDSKLAEVTLYKLGPTLKKGRLNSRVFAKE